MEGKYHSQTNVDCIKYCFCRQVPRPKAHSKTECRNTGYFSEKAVVPNSDITSALDNLIMATTTDQSQVEHPMEKIRQLTDTNKIIGEQLKQLYKTDAFLDNQGQEDKNTTNKNNSYLSKLYPAGYFWTHG